MKLTKKLETLLFMACKQCGSYDPDEALTYIEEQLTSSEYHTATAFLLWVSADPDKRKFGTGNIKQRFAEFKDAT